MSGRVKGSLVQDESCMVRISVRIRRVGQRPPRQHTVVHSPCLDWHIGPAPRGGYGRPRVVRRCAACSGSVCRSNDRRVVKWFLLGDPVPHGTRAVVRALRDQGTGIDPRPNERPSVRPAVRVSEGSRQPAQAGWSRDGPHGSRPSGDTDVGCAAVCGGIRRLPRSVR